MSLFPTIMYHCRLLLLIVWKVRCTFSFRVMFFYVVTTGWMLTSSYYVRLLSINQPIESKISAFRASHIPSRPLFWVSIAVYEAQKGKWRDPQILKIKRVVMDGRGGVDDLVPGMPPKPLPGLGLHYPLDGG